MGSGKKNTTDLLPKLECCESKHRCGRCPRRMLAEGTMPAGLGVRKGRVVDLRHPGVPLTKKALAKAIRRAD